MRKDFKLAFIVLAVLLPVDWTTGVIYLMDLYTYLFIFMQSEKVQVGMCSTSFKAAVTISHLVTIFQQLLWNSIEWNLLYSGKVKQSKLW